MPPGQAGATTSPTGPRHHHDLATPQRAERELVSVEFGQRELGGASGRETLASGFRTKCVQPVHLVVHQGHAESLVEHVHIERSVTAIDARRGYAHVALTETLWLRGPARAVGESHCVDGQGVEDHRPTLTRAH